MSKRPRVVVTVFLVLLAAVLVEAGFAGVAAWRARRPWRTLHVSVGAERGGVGGQGRVLDGPPVRFAGSDRLVVAVGEVHNSVFEYGGEVWIVDSGKLERDLDVFPIAVDPLAARTLTWTQSLPPSMQWFPDLGLEDLVTGTKRSVARQPALSFAIFPRKDLIAVLRSFDQVELRSTLDGSLVRTLTVPAPSRSSEIMTFGEKIRVSPTGDRLAVTSTFFQISVCDLATGAWREDGIGEAIGFTPSGLVIAPFAGAELASPVLVSAGGARRTVMIADEGGGAPYGLSGDGERFAYYRSIKARGTAEVVVETAETHEVLRRVPVRAGHDVRCVALSGAGERLAVAYADSLVEVWEVPGP